MEGRLILFTVDSPDNGPLTMVGSQARVRKWLKDESWSAIR